MESEADLDGLAICEQVGDDASMWARTVVSGWERARGLSRAAGIGEANEGRALELTSSHLLRQSA